MKNKPNQTTNHQLISTLLNNHKLITIRLIESTIRTLIYFNRTTRRSRRRRRSRTAHVALIISLSIIRLIQSIKQTTTTTTTDQPEDEREESNQRLRSILESTNHSLEILINLLDILSLLNNNRLKTTTNLATLTHNILSYAHSSLQKAALWKLGRQTRLEIADTDQTIKANKLRIRSTLQPEHQRALIDQIHADTRLNRARKITIKRCKRDLTRICWARIVFSIDAFISAHDLLELEYCSHGLRHLIDWTSALIDFRSAYWHALESSTLANHSPSP
ncbi:hypothetical protein PGT21_002828 [Puccinia graminis f. sp. tritici]|uniref:Uncharacterized protein n=1 Tax=Puccinia graminis f. sp. tritici TaxID=56615 RepID=A0A5B0M7P6_PUCGR|nr:hypothetical protein PGT21_002828 [Puccinia graminis f. sp. tritici]